MLRRGSVLTGHGGSQVHIYRDWLGDVKWVAMRSGRIERGRQTLLRHSDARERLAGAFNCARARA